MPAKTDTTPVDQSPFRCTVSRTARGRIWSAFVAFLAFASGVVFFFVPVVGWLLLLFCVSFGLLFFLAALVPGKFLLGVALSENGFEFRAPLRTPKFIPFSSIRRIEAFCRGDGETGDAVHLMIYSHAGKVLVKEDVLYRSGLFEALKAQLAFDQDAYRNAAKYVPRGLDLIFGRRFTVYENMQA
jgi:hypothetical protein